MICSMQRVRGRKRDANKNRNVQTLRGQERRPQALGRRLLLLRGWRSRRATWSRRKARCRPHRRRYRRGGPPTSFTRPICRPYVFRSRSDRATHDSSPFDLGEIDNLVVLVYERRTAEDLLVVHARPHAGRGRLDSPVLVSDNRRGTKGNRGRAVFADSSDGSKGCRSDASRLTTAVDRWKTRMRRCRGCIVRSRRTCQALRQRAICHGMSRRWGGGRRRS